MAANGSGDEVHLEPEVFLPSVAGTAAHHLTTAATRGAQLALPEVPAGIDPLTAAILTKMSTWGPERVAIFGDVGASGAHLAAAAAVGAAGLEFADNDIAGDFDDLRG